jgi:hypothetical protein
MTVAPYADVKRLSADFAHIFVREGYSRLREHFDNNPVARIPVLISGHIGGGDTFNQHKYTVLVSDVNVDTDHSIIYTKPLHGGDHFDLSPGDLERLDALAESTIESGRGILSSASYHAQGHVNVPSHWLRELVAAYRQQNPNSASFYFHATEKSDEHGELIEVRLVLRSYWDAHRTAGEEPLSDLLGGRVPYGGTEVKAGVFIYRDRGHGLYLDHMLSELFDAGFRENEGFSEFSAAQ